MVNSDRPSDKELAILNDVDFLTLKETLSKKVISNLADIERAIKGHIDNCSVSFPENALLQAGKISRGENYRGLPYFVLDFPRLFTQKSIFTFRTMLWWGHEYSCTLHLSGEALSIIKEEAFMKMMEEDGLYFCINTTPWEYHFEENNYRPIQQLTPEQIAEHVKLHNFIKISRFISVKHWDQYKSFTLETFARFLMLLK